MTYALVALLGALAGWYARQLLNVLLRIEKLLYGLLRASEGKQVVREVRKVGFAEPKTPVELLAEQEQERIRMMNQ